MKKINLLVILLSAVLLSACEEDTKEYVHIGPNWASLHALQPSEKTFKVDIKADASAILGGKLVFKVKSEQAGKLWILQVDPKDQVSLIYPNAMATEHKIASDSWLSIPADGATWSVEAMEPVGASVLVFIVTTANADLKTVFNGQTQEMDKALRIVENSAAWGLAKQVIEINKE